VFLRSDGFLGQWAWLREHAEVFQGKPYLLPEFAAAYGHAGDVTHATAAFDRVASREHVSSSVLALLALPPMSMTAARWKELGCSLHSPHGSASDMAACIGPHAPADVAMTESDEQELGHWERLDSPAAVEARTGPAPAQHKAPCASATPLVTRGLGVERHSSTSLTGGSGQFVKALPALGLLGMTTRSYVVTALTTTFWSILDRQPVVSELPWAVRRAPLPKAAYARIIIRAAERLPRALQCAGPPSCRAPLRRAAVRRIISRAAVRLFGELPCAASKVGLP